MSIKVLENLDNLNKNERYCEQIFLNKSYIWGNEKEYKKMKVDNIIPTSLKEFFLPFLENKKDFFKDDDDVKDIKKITSTIYMLNEKDMKKIDSIKYFSIVKGAIWGRIDRKKNLVNRR